MQSRVDQLLFLLVAEMTHLGFSLAAAELRLFANEAAQELFELWKTDSSSNVRMLLSYKPNHCY